MSRTELHNVLPGRNVPDVDDSRSTGCDEVPQFRHEVHARQGLGVAGDGGRAVFVPGELRHT
jgi:hypothetical protein